MFAKIFLFGCIAIYMVSDSQGVNNSYYHIEATKMSQPAARLFCRKLGMQLVSIETKAENDYLFQKIAEFYNNRTRHTVYFWSSAEQIDKNWYWVSAGRKVEFTSWRDGETKNSPLYGDCIEINYNKVRTTVRWAARRCNLLQYVICEAGY